MTQDERWIARYNEVKAFIENNKRNPSKHRVEEKVTKLLKTIDRQPIVVLFGPSEYTLS